MNLPPTNLKWLQSSTLFLTRHGSHAYNTNIESSDEDFKGFCVPPREFFFGFNNRFEQAEFRHTPDMVIYDLRKFFKLAADCNPSIIEVLFTDPEDHRINTALGQQILNHRDKFLSRKAKFTFSGYAISQLKKIRSHYRWLKNPPTAAPVRADYGLPDTLLIPKNQLDTVYSIIRNKVEEWDVDITALDEAARIDIKNRISEVLAEQSITSDTQWMAAARSIGLSENFIDTMERENRFGNAQSEWRSYQQWVDTRNPKRSELERKFGYDTKHGMHLVRLMRMGQEIMDGKGVIVKRPDREELLAIRSGAWNYDRILEWADNAQKNLDESYSKSPLPKTADLTFLDQLCQDTIESYLIGV